MSPNGQKLSRLEYKVVPCPACQAEVVNVNRIGLVMRHRMLLDRTGIELAEVLTCSGCGARRSADGSLVAPPEPPEA